LSHHYALLSGGIILGCWAIGLFFLKFWRKTRDRLFLWFAVAFWMLAAERSVGPVFHIPSDSGVFAYLTRLAAFLTILVAIIDKNRTST
jgi:hypothetical protein